MMTIQNDDPNVTLRESMSPDPEHPWGAFLHARVRVMRWLRDDQRQTDAQIAETLSMDEEQVQRILYHR
jgi:hypothetical protein